MAKTFNLVQKILTVTAPAEWSDAKANDMMEKVEAALEILTDQMSITLRDINLELRWEVDN